MPLKSCPECNLETPIGTRVCKCGWVFYQREAVQPPVQIVHDLISDINEMNHMVEYYQNQITRKQIAIEEIMMGVERRKEIP